MSARIGVFAGTLGRRRLRFVRTSREITISEFANMISSLPTIALIVGLFVGMFLCEMFGHWVGRWSLTKYPDRARAGTNTIEAAVLALLGLLLAFSFSASAGRLELRRSILVQEANSIGTAWLRIDLLRPEDQPALRDLFRRYVEERIGVVKALPDVDAALKHHNASLQLQSEIWAKSVAACNAASSPQVALLVLPALNDMIDITTTRSVAANTRQPSLITGLIFAVALLSGMIAGYGMAESPRINRIHIIILAVVVSITVYVILDLENPRAGLIRLDSADQAMEALRDTVK